MALFTQVTSLASVSPSAKWTKNTVFPPGAVVTINFKSAHKMLGIVPNVKEMLKHVSGRCKGKMMVHRMTELALRVPRLLHHQHDL